MSTNTSGLEDDNTLNINQNEKKPLLSLRWILAILGFFFYFIQFFVRCAFPVTVVAMVNSSEFDSETNYSGNACPAANLNSSDDLPNPEGTSGDFSWNTSQQGIILAAFFWGFVIAKLFVSRIGEIVGQRATLATGMAMAGILEFFSPIAASIHPFVFAAVRFLIGFSYGPLTAAMHSLLSAWAPRSELSSMITTILSGATLGGMIGMVVAGWLNDEFGWKITFWIGGLMDFLFIPFWIILVRNSPQKHPWLSPHERKLLEANNYIETKKSVPWLKILSSPYVHICILSHFARAWLDAVLTIEGPSFFRYKIGLGLSATSYICGGSYFNGMIFMLIFGRISDMIVNRNYVRKIYSRKLFHFIGTAGTSILLIGICFADCRTITVIILWILIGGIGEGLACSYTVSVIDVAPNYTATVIGMLALGNLGEALTPIVTSFLLKQKNGWNKSFYLSAGLNFISCIVYVSFMTDEVQSWNFEEENKCDSLEEEK